MKKMLWPWGALGAVLILSVTVAIWARSGSGDREPPPADMEGMDMSGMDMSEDGIVRIEPRMARSLGVTLATAKLGPLRREIRATGNVTFDETRLSTITPKFGGFVERLHVDFTGQAVQSGEPLLEIYSPELVSAQEELLTAVRLERQLAESAAPGVAERSVGLVESARRRLLLWDISPAQIEDVVRTGQVERTLMLHAPFTGVVVEKAVQAGQSVQPGEVLYRLADLSEVWVEADVYERDLRHVREGEAVDIEIDAYPGERFMGRVSYIHPDVRPDTRTARVRIELANPEERIKPGMFATVHIDVLVAERALLVPRDAVMRTGTRSIVFVEQGAGVFETRQVCVGADAADSVQILSGLLAGEQVVARANFILDAESRLMETMMGTPDMPGMEDMDMGMEMDPADSVAPRGREC